MPRSKAEAYTSRYQTRALRNRGEQFADSARVIARTDAATVIVHENSPVISLNPGATSADNVVSTPIPGTDVTVTFSRSRMTPFKLDLTHCTEAELAALRQVMTVAFDIAEPIVKERDEHARAAAERGDDSYYRNYRPLPQLIDRRGGLPEHGSGVQQ